jgi:hypothetical protein
MYTAITHSSAAVFSRSVIARALGALITFSIVGTLLTGAISPAAAANQKAQPQTNRADLTPFPPVVRDHRPKPVVRDHIKGAVIHDHRGESTGGVTVSEGGRRQRGVPCLGNLC